MTLVSTEAIGSLFTGESAVVHTSMPPLPPPPPSSDGGAPGADTTARFRLRVAQLTGAYVSWILGVLRAVAGEVRPDIILRHGMDLGACLLAEELDVPHIPVPCGFVNMLDPASALPALNELRDSIGLPVKDDPASLYPYGRLDYILSAYSFADLPVPVLAYRRTAPVDMAELPPWVTRLPTGRPLVLASVGTSLPLIRDRSKDGRMPPGITDPATQLRTIIAAFSRLDVTAIVATAGIRLDGIEPAPNVHLTDRLPQPLLLECADLLVTHGGYNSVSEAIRTATPMAVLPNFADQPHNARRVQELGLGRHLDDPDPRALADTCQDILHDRTTTARLRAARLAVLGLPDITHAPADLTDITTSRHRHATLTGTP
ncbi:glycosyltransferase [Streptomyces sp. NPDC052164]|uniref:glycosyltransferase n=1 Tax=Streptomyces sp. NPDC052164 TaxID=3155529 RepID=UPI0034156C10